MNRDNIGQWSQTMHLYTFRYRDPLTGKWARACYRAERHEIAARYTEWELIGEPEIRRPRGGLSFSPWHDLPHRTR